MEQWLNGWPRMGGTVIVGTLACCAGCGKRRGTASVALTENGVFPAKLPVWPFEQTCPICSLQERVWHQTTEDKLTARLVAMQGKR